MKILIDARLYGLENAGLGRYVMNLVENLGKLDKKNNYIILLRKKYFNQLNLGDNWTRVLADFGHYSFAEQIKLPQIIKSYNPDITHFPHFIVPIFFKGAFMVTIHDLLMHKSRGRQASTLPLPIYFIKRLFYKLVFRNAVIGALKVIVPSKVIKDELINYYHLDQKKVEVIYEA